MVTREQLVYETARRLVETMPADLVALYLEAALCPA